MIAFDAESIFTKVPIDEIIKNTCFKLKSNYHLMKKNAANDTKYEGLLDGMKFEFSEKLLRKCLHKSFFICNDKIYQQIDGVSMGYPLGPIIANIFMNHSENNHFEELVKKGVKSWDRFVDDTCVIVKSKDNADEILDYLNKQHEKVKFTFEKESDNTLNFLDVKIKRTKDFKFQTSTYRKPTFTGVMLNWNSLTSIRYKTGLIRCLLDRLNKICSSEEQKEIEMALLRLIFLNNNYPSLIIYK